MIAGRIIGWLFLAFAIAVLGLDLAALFGEDEFNPTKVGDVWRILDPNSLQLAEPAIARHLAPWLWYDIILPILVTPAVLIFGMIGIILTAIFRDRLA